MPLAFYDHDRMSFAELPLHGPHIAEFNIGDYDNENSGVGEMGEFKVSLHDFSGVGGKQPFTTPVSIKVSVFADALPALRHMMALGSVMEIEPFADIEGVSNTEEARRAFSRRLLDLQLLDTSDRALDAPPPKIPTYMVCVDGGVININTDEGLREGAALIRLKQLDREYPDALITLVLEREVG